MNTIVVTLDNVDCAVVDNKGNLTGHSFKPIVEVSGEIADNEQVVIDFGKVKKSLNGLISSSYNGLDHKVLIIKDWSLFDLSATKFMTKNFVGRLPADGMQILPKGEGSTTQDMLYTSTKAWFEKLFLKIEKHFSITLRLAGFDSAFTPYVAPGYTSVENLTLSYTHLLPKSTSYGCNSLHGHISTMKFMLRSGTRTFSRDKDKLGGEIGKFKQLLADQINGSIEDTFFLARKEEMSQWEGNTECNRRVELGLNTINNTLFMGTETTIENFSSHLGSVLVNSSEHMKSLLTKGDLKIFITEGLDKGALLTI